jgi:hypothetical protein
VYVSDIRHPDLVDGVYFEVLNEIWIDLKAMVAVGCGNPSFLSGSARPALIAHDPGHLLVVYDPSFTVELFGNPSVSIAGELQAYVTNTSLQGLVRELFFGFVIVRGSCISSHPL